MLLLPFSYIPGRADKNLAREDAQLMKCLMRTSYASNNISACVQGENYATCLKKGLRGHGGAVAGLPAPTQANRVRSPAGVAHGFSHVRIVPLFSPQLSDTAPYSPCFILISSQDLDIKSHPNLFTHYPLKAPGVRNFTHLRVSKLHILKANKINSSCGVGLHIGVTTKIPEDPTSPITLSTPFNRSSPNLEGMTFSTQLKTMHRSKKALKPPPPAIVPEITPKRKLEMEKATPGSSASELRKFVFVCEVDSGEEGNFRRYVSVFALGAGRLLCLLDGEAKFLTDELRGRPAYLPPGRSGFNPRPGHSGFSHLGIVPDDAIGRRVFSGISRFLRPFIPALLHTHLDTLIVSQDLDVKSRPNLFTNSN
ncbi:hypothetical protein PR048_033436 [Dryococelus australis]|uniref:Uncharacterized protein n=1 Tax=Dryococelus australis TaxID=614101 RepID=A0ABQ9G098_9NEOP|nr:hypothetical protein PR048_033436 [Dryococelus australis]